MVRLVLQEQPLLSSVLARVDNINTGNSTHHPYVILHLGPTEQASHNLECAASSILAG